MKELIVIFLIVLVIYLNRSQCKTQKGGATATTVGIGFVMTAIIAVAGYFAYKELSGPSPSSPDDSDDTSKVVSDSSKKRKKKGGDIINNYYFTDVGEDVIRCDSRATDPPAFCPDNSQCPASGICPSGGGNCLQQSINICRKDPECRKCMGSERITNIGCGGMGLTDTVCTGSQPGPVPSGDDFVTGKLKMRIRNSYGHGIVLFMRSSVSPLSPITISPSSGVVDKGNLPGKGFTKLVRIPNSEDITLLMDVNSTIKSFSAWFIKDTVGSYQGTSFVDHATKGPTGGATCYEFNLEDKRLDANISYVNGINSNMEFHLYQDSKATVLGKNICNFTGPPDYTQTTLKGVYDIQKYKIYDMPVIFASKFSLENYGPGKKYTPGSENKFDNPTEWAEDKALLANRLDRCAAKLALSNNTQNECRRHVAEKIQDPNSYCGFLMKANCPYCWGLGEFYCIDPDVYENSSGTCEEKLKAATQGPKALGCGYNIEGINHFNWPKMEGKFLTMGVAPNYSMGSQVYPDSSLDGSTYWFNSGDCGSYGKPYTAPDGTQGMKCPTQTPPLENCKGTSGYSIGGNINFGALELKSLNSITLEQSSAYYLEIDIKGIPWLT